MRLIVGMSGASGVIYGIRLLEVLRAAPDVETHLVMTPAARQTIGLETDWAPGDVAALADVCHRFRDIAAAPSSGSFHTDGMIVAPCSMRTVSSIAISANDNLLTRAADVTLKERRRLVLVARETPLHLGHLRLLTQAAEIGAVIAPPAPAFYHRPDSLADMVDYTVLRLLDLFGMKVPDQDSRRWSGPTAAEPAPPHLKPLGNSGQIGRRARLS
ncbi:MAG: UbiX family flavin prenyltransferase [Micromonosporaceae bacterium]